MPWPYPNSRRSSEGSWLRNFFDNTPRSTDTFLCGVRVVSGQLEGQGRKWAFRKSAADELVVDGVVSIQHGNEARLRVRLLREQGSSAPRPGHVVVVALEVDSGAEVELSLPAGELIRFGVEGL